MEHDGLKERMIEAAEMADRLGMHIRMEVLQGGIRMTLLRQNTRGEVMRTENYTPWISIEEARINPLPVVMRDLINQMDDMLPRTENNLKG